MSFKRWNATVALLGTLYLQSFALAQEPELHAFVESLVGQAEETQKEPSAKSPEQTGDSVITSRKIVIQLPNGETREITLPPTSTGTMDVTLMSQQGEPFVPPKFLIGVALAEVPDSLRSHVTLPAGQGVMVGSVTPEGPAAKAGIEKFDVLLKAGDLELKHPNDLKAVIDGNDIKPVMITLQRRGEQKTVEVTPVKREDLILPLNGEMGLERLPVLGKVFVTEGVGNQAGLRIAPSVISGPSHVIVSPQQSDELTQAILKLSEQIDKLQQKVERLERELDKSDDNSSTDSKKGDGDCRKVPRSDLLTSFSTMV